MIRTFVVFALSLGLYATGVRAQVAVAAQAATPSAQPVNVFLDCQASDCDTSHFRTEITFVNWVRDRTDADVHLLITSEGTGSGGTHYALSFIGLRAFARDSLQLNSAALQTATPAERRRLLTNRIAQGLLHYAIHTSAAENVTVKAASTGDDADSGGTLPAGVRDPWNHWVFSAGINASADGEQQQASKDFELQIEASRVTDVWKLEFSAEGSYEENRFELDEGTLRSIRRNWNSDLQVTRAIAAQWSAGLEVDVGTSTFRNQDLYNSYGGVLEYSFFPYDEFSRRRMTLQYLISLNRYDYTDLTIFDKLQETVMAESLVLETRYQQPWGSAGLQLEGSHYFHDLSRYELGAEAFVDVRLFKGLSAEVSGAYSRVHNQLYIRKGDASDEDVLLERLALATGYQYEVRAGLSYTFGSIFNNIVNRRLD
jgi:hypothetical protein